MDAYNARTKYVQLKVEMFGGFVVYCNDQPIVRQIRKSPKIWRLIQYLLKYRHKTVTLDELINTFCNDEQQVAKPSNALRTLVFRARAALSSSGIPEPERLILSGNSGYRWNIDVNCTIDVEEFEALLRKADSSTEPEERLELILQAANLYKGDFLPNSAGELWVMPLARWYRTAFIDSVYEAVEILTRNGRYAEAEVLCAKAIRTDPFNERILEHYLRTLIARGKNLEALDEYRKMKAMYYDVLGVTFSQSLVSLHDQIQRIEIREDSSLENLLDEWLFGADFPGAYYCDVSVFKAVCQIEARSAARSGRTTYIVRIDVDYHGEEEGGCAIRELSQTIPKVLRKGDLYTRLDTGQFMLMLNSLTHSDCTMLIDRMLNSFDDAFRQNIIATSIEAIKPIV